MKKNKRKKFNIGKGIASLFTKRKIISLTCSILSLAVAVGYFAYTAMCGFNIDTVTKSMGDTADGLWGFKLIKYASLNLIFSVLGIMLFAIFGLYRLLMAYYYFKIYRGKEDFYKSQRKETILFSVLSLVMVVVYGILYSNEKITMPFVKNEGVLAMLIVYIILALLPIVEMVGNAITIAIENRIKKKGEIPDKDKIAKEIDELAAKNAELAKSGDEGEVKEETSEKEEGFGKKKRREVTDKITAMLKKSGLYDEDVVETVEKPEEDMEKAEKANEAVLGNSESVVGKITETAGEEKTEKSEGVKEEKETAETVKIEEKTVKTSDGNAILDKKYDSEYNISEKELERLTEIYESDIKVSIGELGASSHTDRRAWRTCRNRDVHTYEKREGKTGRGIREDALRRSDRKRRNGRSGKGRGKKGTRKFRNGLVKRQNRKVGRSCRR